ncbi:MFS transporter [Streptomyces marispadix]|uniref:MFS transporter n=1 Tax=Streptomyces marispadix TaxID=2922868 RepID=A0ABS9T4S8_9ACTN|nr:MFS transporter [Streptomyces marispadix]MCH6163534.1 MFS transporter [Streptomyces marispadix]
MRAKRADPRGDRGTDTDTDTGTDTGTGSAGNGHLGHGGRTLSPALVAVCLGYFMVILDTTIVNAALPALRWDLHAGMSGLQWVVDGYMLTLAAGLLTGGALADRMGARRVFQAGLALFALSSAACGLAPHIWLLVLARLVQGAAAALSVPASLALLRAAFPERASRARAIGAWGAVAGLAAASGPVLGGLLVSHADWRLVFYVNLPVAVVAMVLTARHVPAPAPRPRPLDPAAQTAGAVALAALTYALIEGGRMGAGRPVLAAGALCVVAAAVFLTVERRVAHPMLPLGLFRDRAFTGATLVGLLINLGFYGELLVLNLAFQQTSGHSALAAGLALLPQMGIATIGSALSGRFTARTGSPRPTMLAGLLTGSAGLFALAMAGAGTGTTGYAVLVAPLVAVGFGMSFTMPAATTAVVDAAPAEHAGLASGVINAARQTGGVIGVALLGALAYGAEGSSPGAPSSSSGPPSAGAFAPDGMHTALAAAGCAFLLAAALTALTVPRIRREAANASKSPASEGD